MTRKEFLQKSIMFLGGIFFLRKTKLFIKIFDPSKKDIKEAKYYRKY